MAPLMVAFAPAAKIEAKVTSATPIMSAAAVTAVRPGWRTEFSRASWPVMPVARSIGRPMTFASGRTSRGESSATPRKVSAAPPPMNEIAALSDFRLPKSPTHMSPTPIASSTPAPMAIRRPRPRCIGTTPSRRASTGGTRMARIAGAMLATRLTTVPTRIVTITVRLSMTTPLLGRSAPKALNSVRRSAAVPMPSRKPTTPPTKPSSEPLVDDRPPDLAARRAEGAQQRELAHALGDGDREGVEDQEGAHEQRDEGEREQEGLQEPEVVADVLGLLVRLLLAGAHVDRRAERARQLRLELLGRDAGLGGDLDLVEAVALAEHPLGLGQHEVEHRGAAERAQAGDLGRPDERVALAWRGGDGADLVADLPPLLVGRRGVDRRLVRRSAACGPS